MSVEVANIGRRGDIEIELLSPSGTTSTLLGQRPRDYRASGYIEWPFMSVMFWGEDPAGNWSLSVSSGSTETVIEISDIRFQFFGVLHTPDSVATIPTKCHNQCARGCAKTALTFVMPVSTFAMLIRWSALILAHPNIQNTMDIVTIHLCQYKSVTPLSK